jgi:hypothetical protein
MRALALALLVLLFAAEAAAATKIYKIVDRDGNVVFTDQPPSEAADAAEVELRSGNSFEATPLEPEPWIVDAANGDESGPAPYTRATIVAPANDESVRDNAGNVTVSVSVAPALRAGDQVRLLLDGLPHGTSRGLEFTLSNVDRGTHTLAVEVIDSSGAVLLTGAPSTFHLLRYSALSTGPQPVPQGG